MHNFYNSKSKPNAKINSKSVLVLDTIHQLKCNIILFIDISVHFVKMLALIGFNGIQKFDELDNDLQKQIQYVYNLIHEEAEYKSIR